MKWCLILILSIVQSAMAFDGLVPWQWQQSRCQDCGIYIKIKPEFAVQLDPRVEQFIAALENQKRPLVDLYGIDPQEYNLLAWMSIGILGRESSFFEGIRYQIKELAPPLVRIAKKVEALRDGKKISENSRGPTQIKKVPSLIQYAYGIEVEDLVEPDKAAVATMGFLIEALAELKQRAKNNGRAEITPDKYVDYLPYIYFGQAQKISNGQAQPNKNAYIQEMKAHMKKFEIFEVIY